MSFFAKLAFNKGAAFAKPVFAKPVFSKPVFTKPAPKHPVISEERAEKLIKLYEDKANSLRDRAEDIRDKAQDKADAVRDHYSARADHLKAKGFHHLAAKTERVGEIKAQKIEKLAECKANKLDKLADKFQAKADRLKDKFADEDEDDDLDDDDDDDNDDGDDDGDDGNETSITFAKVFFVSDELGGLAVLGPNETPQQGVSQLPSEADGTFEEYVAFLEDSGFLNVQDVNSIIFYDDAETFNEVLRIEAPEGGFEDAEAMIAAFNDAAGELESFDMSSLFIGMDMEDAVIPEDEDQDEDMHG